MKKSTKKLLLLILFFVIIILLISLVSIYVFAFRGFGTNQRRTFYTNYIPLDGGACSYYEYSLEGSKTDKCVEGVNKALALIPPPNPNIAIPQVYKFKLIKIDADVHIEIQKRSPSTPKPNYQNYEIINIDKVYSAEEVSIDPQFNAIK